MNDRFLRACRREPVDRVPLWIMRQAGRYLPEYRALRERADFLALCRTPELAVEATLQPLRRFGLDAAILFSDIILPLQAMGVDIAFEPGPRILSPVRTRADVDRLHPAAAEEALPFVGEAVALLRRELDGRTPLIGFCGAPFTLAAYLVEGGGSDGFPLVRRMLHEDPATLGFLLEKLADQMADYLAMQIRHGAQAVQLFDSWAGLLSRAQYRALALPATRRLVNKLGPGRPPVIHFAAGADHLLEDFAETGAEVLGVCWRSSIADARRRTGGRVAIQGNLDPCALLGTTAATKVAAAAVLADAGKAPGHVMNLGHGILPSTPIASVEALVETVAECGRRDA